MRKPPPRSLSDRPKVLPLIEPWQGNRRELIAGVVAYARQHTNWDFVPVYQPTFTPADLVDVERVDGVLFAPRGPLLDAVRATGKPAVTEGGEATCRIGTVEPDSRQIADMALAHLQGLGLRRLALAGDEAMRETARTQAFRDQVRGAGTELHEHFSAELDDDHRIAAMGEAWGPWLVSLPKPVGVFCVRAAIATRVVFAAHLHDVRVPEEVAVLGVGANDVECEMCTPALSTIDTGSHRRGWEMAALLDRMMQGGDAEHVVVPPRGVTTRRSTDMLAIDNPNLARAIRHIRDRACDDVRINQIFDEIPMSRRSIEMGMRATFGRSVRDEIVRLRIDRAKELLDTSSMSMPEIAARCGFAYASHLNRVFKAEVGTTPTAYRRRFG